ncbi:hypothetical protein X777_10265 [Ooceraea biroi]|uniref:Integrase catalytic domain-containing protein n=1 Tax=Ooceraea biroi TaxID=2015173 RepID=A0A026W836_OOCBI|nr:hypothetical protein X777_10265 [Ooceraea biroi]
MRAWNYEKKLKKGEGGIGKRMLERNEEESESCESFLKLDSSGRMDKVKALKLCTNCPEHFSKGCSFGACKICNAKHTALLHFERGKAGVEKGDTQKTSSTVATICQIQSEGGRFIVKLPLKQNPSVLGDSRKQAEKRMLALERRLLRNKNLHSEYSAFLKEYENLDHMQRVLDDEERPHMRKERSLIARIIRKSFYVDDFLYGGDIVNEVLFIAKEMSSVLSNGCFELHKWNTNNSEIRKRLMSDGNSLAEVQLKGGIKRTLGLVWRVDDSLTYPIMSHLFRDRVTSAFAFEIAGIDYAGPFQIKDHRGRGCKVSKCYICLFICFTPKAMHIELVSDLTSETFVVILRRFVSRRGRPTRIYSDNGTNFVGGNTSHFGGLWEPGVRSIKYHLKRVAANALLTFEELYTLLVQVKAILNPCPLTPLSSDPTDLSPLTPAHFLIGRRFDSVVDPSFLGSNHNFDWNNVKIVHQESFYKKREIAEMCYIKKYNTVNLQQDTESLSCVYYSVLRHM